MNLLVPFQEETTERFVQVRTELAPDVLGKTIPKHFDATQAKAIVDALGVDWHNYTKIVLIRDPWRRLVSY